MAIANIKAYVYNPKCSNTKSKNKMKTQLENLLSREMTRKEFLQHVGSGMLIMFGISGLLKAMTRQNSSKQGMGYGSSAYGE